MRLKYKSLAVLTIIFSLLLSTTCFGAESLGELTTVTDTVLEDGANGRISTTAEGLTNTAGELAFPSYQDAELLSIKAVKGTLTSDPTVIENGSITYYLLQFSEAESEVAFTIEWTQTDTYVPSKAKTKDTAPGGLKAIKYSMLNASPIPIAEYHLDLAVPDGFELSSIVDYDPEEDFSVSASDGTKFASYTFGQIKQGGEAKMTINIKKVGSSMAIIMWAITILVSAFFLYKNRRMLTEAKELAAKKAAMKQTGGAK